ncbi:MAG: hypothetical protein QW144_00590 [Candidatus Micrarchaeaceae archaeon]
MAAEKEILSIDLDGVLADLVTAANELRSKELKKIVRKEELGYYDLRKTGPYNDLKWSRIIAYFKDAWANYKEIKLEDQRIPEIIKSLRDYYYIWIVTATVGKDEQIRSWLEQNDISYDELIHLDKQIKKIKNVASIHIEDYYELAAEMPPSITILMLRQPWNEKFFTNGANSHGNILYMKDWQEIQNYLLKRALSRANNYAKV